MAPETTEPRRVLFSAQVPAAAHARTSAATVRTLIVSYTTLPAAADAPAANAGAAPATIAPTTSRLPTRGAGRRWPRRCKPNRTGVSAEDSRGSDAEGRRAASAECRHTGFGGAAPHAKHEISLAAVTLCLPNAGAVSVSQGLREPAGCNVAAPPAVNTYARTRHGCIAPLAPNLTVRRLPHCACGPGWSRCHPGELEVWAPSVLCEHASMLMCQT